MKKLFAMVGLLSFAVCVIAMACGSRTSGVKLTFQASAIGSLSNGKAVTSFTNRRNWTLNLERAHMLVGPVYLYEGESRAGLWQYLRPWGIAHAHVSATGQRVLAEIREHFVVDLLKPSSTSLGTMRGIDGIAQTAELYLLPPGGTRLSSNSASITHVSGATIFAQGTATKDQETHKFQLSMTLAQGSQKQKIPQITTEISLQKETVDKGQMLLRIYVDRWFTNVDFARFTDKNKDKEGRILLSADDNAIVQGIRSRHSYNLSWRPN